MTRREIPNEEESRRRFEADAAVRQSNVLPLDAARNEGRFYGKLFRNERPLTGVQRIGFFLVVLLLCGSAFFIIAGAFAGLLRFAGLQALPTEDKSVSIVSLPFAALILFLGTQDHRLGHCAS